jgi:hypothetical protein
MKIIRQQSNLNTRLPLSVSVWEVDMSNELLSNINQNEEAYFDALKARAFDISEKKSDSLGMSHFDSLADYNYSNFSVSKIEFSDFRSVNIDTYKELIKSKIQNWSKTYNNMEKSELEWFIDVTVKQIDAFAVNFSTVYIFDLDPQLNHIKRHPHFDLYEFFISLLFVKNKIYPSRISYAELAYG